MRPYTLADYSAWKRWGEGVLLCRDPGCFWLADAFVANDVKFKRAFKKYIRCKF
jgi:hypothetical protein